MPSRTPEDRLGEYLHVLRGLGCDESDVVEAHGGLPDADRLRDRLLEGVTDHDPESLYDSLHAAIAAVPHGLAVPRDADLETVGGALADALESYGCSLSIQRDDDGTATVTVTDAEGTARTTTVERPELTPAPAVMHAVAADPLADIDVRFALLAPHDDEWRAVLANEARLTALQRRFGLRIETFGSPLLCRDQPADFAAGTATVHLQAEPTTAPNAEADEVAADSGNAEADDVEERTVTADDGTYTVRGSPDRVVSDRPLEVPEGTPSPGDAAATTVVAAGFDESLDDVTVASDSVGERTVDTRDVDELLHAVDEGRASVTVETAADTRDGIGIEDLEGFEDDLASAFEDDVIEGTTFREATDSPELHLELATESRSEDPSDG